MQEDATSECKLWRTRSGLIALIDTKRVAQNVFRTAYVKAPLRFASLSVVELHNVHLERLLNGAGPAPGQDGWFFSFNGRSPEKSKETMYSSRGRITYRYRTHNYSVKFMQQRCEHIAAILVRIALTNI